MRQDKQFNNILNECLDRVLRGETVEKCLQSYPEQARELEPLLRTALAAKQAAAVQPRAEFKAQARYAFNSALRERELKKSHRWSFFKPSVVWRTGWAVAIAIVLVVGLGGGTVVMASNSMPDSPFYGVKLATEQAQLAVTPSGIGKAELNARFADRRADEITYLANKGDAREVQIAAQRMNSNLENMTSLAKSSSKDNKTSSSATFNADSPAANKSANIATGNIPQPQPAPPGATLPAAGPAAVPSPARSVVPGTVPTSAASITPKTSGVPPPAAAPAPATSAVPAAPAVKGPPPTSSEVAAGAGSQVFSKNGPTSLATAAPGRSAADNAARGNTDSSQNNARTSQFINAKDGDQAKIKQIIVDNFNNRQNRLNEALKKASPEVRPALRQAMAKSQDEFEKALKNLEQNDDDN